MARKPVSKFPRVFVKVLFPVLAAAIFGVAVWVLSRELRTISLADVLVQFGSYSAGFVVTAILLVILDYFVLTWYDFTALTYVGAKPDYKTIAPISFSAFAIGHNVGLASLSGGAIRYRAYSLIGLSTSQIAITLVFISLTFALGSSALLGITLLIEPESSMPALPFEPLTMRLGGVLLLALPIGYLVWISFKHLPVKIKDWTFTPPSLKVGLAQLGLSCVDVVLTSTILFVLLRATTDINYFVFLGVYLLAMGAGTLSNIPGAIGVFESVFFVLLPGIPVPELVAAMIAFRLIYYLVPLIFALLIIVVREIGEHKAQLQSASELTLAWGIKLVPQAVGAAVFLIGAYLVLGGAMPFSPGQITLLQNLIPLPLLEMSHLLSSAVGMGLLLVARGLYRRLYRAYIASVVLIVVGGASLLLQTFDWFQLALMVLLIGILWLSRAEFYRGKKLLDQRFDPGWITSIGIVIAATIGLGLFAQSNVEYSNELWWQFTFRGDASRMLRAGLVVALIAVVFVIAKLLQGSPDAELPSEFDEQERQRISPIIQASSTSLSNVALLGDKRFLYHPSGDAAFMYQASGRSWITLGDPMGNPARFEELIWQFREQCDANNVRCVFYQISEAYLSHYIDLGLSFSKLGEEGSVDLKSFGLEGSARSDLRQAINRAGREGAEFSIVPADSVAAIISQLKLVSDQWLTNKNAHEKGFSLGYFDAGYLVNFDCAVVRVQGEIVAFANLWKSGNGKALSVDLMRYNDAAPKSIMDYLFAQIMLWGKEQGFESFSLGMAPLSGLERRALAPLWHKLGNLIYRFGEDFYNFDGLRKYKEKFEPAWEPRFIACKGGLELPSVLLDTTALISGGVKEILFK